MPARSAWAEMLEIYNSYVADSDCTFDLKVKTMTEFQVKLSFSSAWPRVIVGQDDDTKEICGWASNLPWSQKEGFSDIGEVSIYVKKGLNGRGWGGTLLDGLITEAEKAGMFSLIAFVTEGNIASEQLLQGRGFGPIGSFQKLGRKFERRYNLNMYQRNLAGRTPPSGV